MTALGPFVSYNRPVKGRTIIIATANTMKNKLTYSNTPFVSAYTEIKDIILA